MLLLVFADRHVRGFVEQNVRRLQHRIIEQTHGRTLCILASLVFELGHALQPAHARDAIQQPSKLGVLAYGGLNEDGRALGINAGGDVRGGDFTTAAGEIFRIGASRDRMQIDDAINALVLILQAHKLLQGAEIIAEMQAVGRLHA